MSTKNKILLFLCAVAAGAGIFFFSARYRSPSPVPIVTEGTRIEDFALLDQNATMMEFSRQTTAKAVALISYGVGCPIVRKMLPKLEQLREKYSAKGIRFFFVDANPQDTRASLQAEAKEFGIKIPILLDETQDVLRGLNVERTGEVILVEPKSRNILYRGAIDDRFGYGSSKPQAAENYFERAADQFLAGRAISHPNIPALGCAIEYLKAPAVTYTQHVRPILEAKCYTCHVNQKVAPTNIIHYRDLRGWGRMLREVIRAERMPPWEADETVCDLGQSVALTAEEKRTIFAWVDSGYPEGPPVKEKKEVFHYPSIRPDLVLQMKAPVKIKADDSFPWHYEQLIAETAEEMWISGYHFEFTNPAVLNHVNIFYTQKPVDISQNIFEPEWADPENVSGMLWGTISVPRPYKLKNGLAFRIPKGSRVYLELHFTPTGKPETEFVKVSLEKYSDSVPPRELKFNNIWLAELRIPPGSESTWAAAEKTVEKNIQILATGFHMHARGKSVKFSEISRDGKLRPLCNLPRFLLKNKLAQIYKKPLAVSAGSRLRVEFEYDNSPANPTRVDSSKEVRWGQDQREDEMGRMYYWSFDSSNARQVKP
ncbi:MAG: redoxin family protein [Bacteriovoracia bacterium]